MTLILILVVAGLVGAVVMYAPSILLTGLLITLRSLGKKQLLDLADGIERFFDIHGIRYEPPYKISARRSGNRWIQAVLAPIAILWKYIAVAVGFGVAIWLFE